MDLRMGTMTNGIPSAPTPAAEEEAGTAPRCRLNRARANARVAALEVGGVCQCEHPPMSVANIMAGSLLINSRTAARILSVLPVLYAGASEGTDGAAELLASAVPRDAAGVNGRANQCAMLRDVANPVLIHTKRLLLVSSRNHDVDGPRATRKRSKHVLQPDHHRSFQLCRLLPCIPCTQAERCP